MVQKSQYKKPVISKLCVKTIAECSTGTTPSTSQIDCTDGADVRYCLCNNGGDADGGSTDCIPTGSGNTAVQNGCSVGGKTMSYCDIGADTEKCSVGSTAACGTGIAL